MMMDYCLGMMPGILFLHGLVFQTHRQKCLFLRNVPMQKYTEQAPRALFTHVVHYTTLVLAAKQGSKGRFKKCFILVLLYMPGD